MSKYGKYDAKDVEENPKFAKIYRTRPDASEGFLMHPDVSEQFRAGSNGSEHV